MRAKAERRLDLRRFVADLKYGSKLILVVQVAASSEKDHIRCIHPRTSLIRGRKPIASKCKYHRFPTTRQRSDNHKAEGGFRPLVQSLSVASPQISFLLFSASATQSPALFSRICRSSSRATHAVRSQSLYYKSVIKTSCTFPACAFGFGAVIWRHV